MLVGWEQREKESEAGGSDKGAQGQKEGACFCPVPRLRPSTVLCHWFFSLEERSSWALTEEFSGEDDVRVWRPAQSQPMKGQQQLLWGCFLPHEARDVLVSGRATLICPVSHMLRPEGVGNMARGAFCHLWTVLCSKSLWPDPPSGMCFCVPGVGCVTLASTSRHQTAPVEGHSCAKARGILGCCLMSTPAAAWASPCIPSVMLPSGSPESGGASWGSRTLLHHYENDLHPGVALTQF